MYQLLAKGALIAALLTPHPHVGPIAQPRTPWAFLAQINRYYQAVDDAVAADANRGGCTNVARLVHKLDPANEPRWMQIIEHESRCTPWAANPRSTARGLTQLLISLHGWRFTGACAGRYLDARCNLLAAISLQRDAGWLPWKGAY